jgi:hypothetical protein
MEQTNSSSPKCKQCNLFFANSAFSGYCSKCYKDSSKDKETQDNKTSVSVEDRELQEEFAGLSLKEEKEEKLQQADRKRCFCCNKRINLLGVECKCGYVFCNGHRMPEDHKCSFNHKAVLDEKLKRQLNKVAHEKVIDF